MSVINIKGNPVKTIGNLPGIGSNAPDFLLTKTDLSDIRINNFEGKNIILNIFPSIDTPVCSASVRRFNTEVTQLEDTVVLCVSLDLPFAHGRFCAAEGIENVIPVSVLRNTDFIKKYGVVIDEGLLEGLLARAVVVIDKKGTVIYAETVHELTDEPDYEEILSVLTTPKETQAPVAAAEEVKLDRCTYTATAENARSYYDDEPCDDGRAG